MQERNASLRDEVHANRVHVIQSDPLESSLYAPTPQKGSIMHSASATSLRKVRPRKHESSPIALGQSICPLSNMSGEANAPL